MILCTNLIPHQLQEFPMSLLYLLRLVRSNGLSSVFSPAHMEISVSLGDSHPPQPQIEFPKKHTTHPISYPLFLKFPLLSASLAAIIMDDVTERTTTKGNKWNVMENVEFCRLSRTQSWHSQCPGRSTTTRKSRDCWVPDCTSVHES